MDREIGSGPGGIGTFKKGQNRLSDLSAFAVGEGREVCRVDLTAGAGSHGFSSLAQFIFYKRLSWRFSKRPLSQRVGRREQWRRSEGWLAECKHRPAHKHNRWMGRFFVFAGEISSPRCGDARYVQGITSLSFSAGSDSGMRAASAFSRSTSVGVACGREAELIRGLKEHIRARVGPLRAPVG